MQNHHFAAILAMTLASPALASCIDVRTPNHLQLKGFLTFHIFPGNPNFEDVRKGDRPEPTYTLHVDTPICATGDDFVSPSERVDQVQVYAPGETARDRQITDNLARLRNQHVTVQIASLFGAHTGHHHAPLLATLDSIEPAAPTEPTSSQTVVHAFYDALAAGAGDEAAQFVIPAKRSRGPLSAAALTAYYGSLEQRLILLSAKSINYDEHLVSYRFTKAGGSICNGRAIITTTTFGESSLIVGIRALDGC